MKKSTKKEKDFDENTESSSVEVDLYQNLNDFQSDHKRKIVHLTRLIDTLTVEQAMIDANNKLLLLRQRNDELFKEYFGIS